MPGDIIDKINNAEDFDKIRDDPDYDPEEVLDRIDELDEDKIEDVLEDL